MARLSWIHTAGKFHCRRLLTVTVVLAAVACSRSTSLSTEEIVGEWQKQGRMLPPVSLLISSEGSGLRARLQLSGAEADASAIVRGRTLRLKFDQRRPDMVGEFVSNRELDLRLQPNGEVYRLRRRP